MYTFILQPPAQFVHIYIATKCTVCSHLSCNQMCDLFTFTLQTSVQFVHIYPVTKCTICSHLSCNQNRTIQWVRNFNH